MKILLKSMLIPLIIFIIIMVLITIIIFTIGIFSSQERLLKLEWKIDIPKANKEEIIYRTFGISDGVELQIWEYDNKKAENIINNSKFSNIDNIKIIPIKKDLYNYYDILPDDEKNLFNNNIDFTSLLSEDNYFAYTKKDDGSWVLLVLNITNNKLYYFTYIM